MKLLFFVIFLLLNTKILEASARAPEPATEPTRAITPRMLKEIMIYAFTKQDPDHPKAMPHPVCFKRVMLVYNHFIEENSLEKEIFMMSGAKRDVALSKRSALIKLVNVRPEPTIYLDVVRLIQTELLRFGIEY
jgi:hypothetical protein